MSVTPLKSPRAVDAGSAPEALRQARMHLAAALRLAVLDDLEEGIDNHFTMTVPGSSDRTWCCRSACTGRRPGPAT